MGGRRGELVLLRLDPQVRRVVMVVCAGAVLLLLDFQNVDGAAIAREQILAVVGIEEFGEGFDLGGDHDEIVLRQGLPSAAAGNVARRSRVG